MVDHEWHGDADEPWPQEAVPEQQNAVSAIATSPTSAVCWWIAIELSRAGEREGAPERLPLADIASRAARRWEATAGERSQRVVCDGRQSGHAWFAPADADRILDALVEKALNYSPDGSEVTVAAVPSGLEVRDRGNGIEPGEEDSVFGRCSGSGGGESGDDGGRGRRRGRGRGRGDDG